MKTHTLHSKTVKTTATVDFLRSVSTSKVKPHLIKPPWMTPAISYPRRKLGAAEIRSYKMPPGVYDMYGVRGVRLYELRKPIVTTNLLIRRRVWMVDDPPHWYAMLEHAKHYHGHVLCAGLGLGLIVHALYDNRQVYKITVIEREQDVIDLVKPLLPDDDDGKIQVLHGDFWDLDSWVIDPVDGVFYDLFVGDGRELQSAALRVWFQLSERWGRAVRRIHGFNNETLSSLDQLIERL